MRRMLQRVGIAAGHRGANLRDQFRALFEEKLRHFTKQLLVPAEALGRDGEGSSDRFAKRTAQRAPSKADNSERATRPPAPMVSFCPITLILE
jgi:hypothetical protein